MLNSNPSRILTILLFFFFSAAASAETLQVPEDANILVRVGADIVLYTHIIGGALGLLTGLIASLTKKGGFLHRRSGRVFMISMFACYGIGAIVAPFLTVGQRPNFVAAILALYLLASGIQAAKLKSYTATKFNLVGLIVSFAVALMGIIFMYMASQSDTGTVDGSPAGAFVLFVIAGSFAFIGELRVLLIKKLSAQGRVYRHLWRMCFSFFIASGSLFGGQPQVFPDWFNASPLPALCAAFPLFVLIYWTIKTVIKAMKNRAKAPQKAPIQINS
jgi:uncharacterized membrane protein